VSCLQLLAYNHVPGVECVKTETVACDVNDGCEDDKTWIQPLSPESNLIEIARHSNPVVVLEKLDTQRYSDISFDFTYSV